tara:strand:- start:124 stop:942 length:819 start_codon:yes stop_codon:yes gene_type:complete
MEMKTLTIKKSKINYRSFRHRKADESDCATLIDEDVTIYKDQETEPTVVYKTNIDTKGLLKACQNIDYQTSTRTSGMVTTSRIFGYSPRNHIRNAPCRATSLAKEDAENHKSLVEGAEIAASIYEEFAPSQAKKHMAQTERLVLPQYRLGKSMFTSGIVNENNPLLYHFDSGNYPNVWSAMFAFKHKIDGGYLCCPELDVKFATSNNSVIMFDGQGLLHGVSPIKMTSEDSKRYTIVYYSLKNMWSCEALGDEISNMRASRTLTEMDRAGLR